ncbi:MAG: signal peptide peptidase SppA [Nanoarchaeota archaeon]|nr:signal peptide peptidase SppA [Nanoarchaeota archaeon]
MVDFIKLKEDGDADDDGKKKKKMNFLSIKGFLIIFVVFFIASSVIASFTYSLSSKIAVVPISGPIMTEKTTSIYGSSISSRDIANTLRVIGEDSSIKAVLLDINSPGGSPVASEEISKAIEELKKKKKVYALVNDVGASGAFWVAVSTDKIFASSMSTLGSIGVTSAGLSFEDFIREYNVTYRRQTAGKYKDMGTPYRKMSEEEEAIIQGLLDEIHGNFISHVANSRNMNYSYVEEYATGEVFLGSKALRLGFIDEIAYYPDVIEELRKVSGAGSSAIIVNYGPEPTLLEVIGVETISEWFAPNTKSQLLLE